MADRNYTELEATLIYHLSHIMAMNPSDYRKILSEIASAHGREFDDDFRKEVRDFLRSDRFPAAGLD